MAAVELVRNDEFLERAGVAGGRDDGVEFVAIKLVAGLLDVGAETKPDAGPRSRSQSTMHRTLPAADAVDAFDEWRQRDEVGEQPRYRRWWLLPPESRATRASRTGWPNLAE